VLWPERNIAAVVYAMTAAPAQCCHGLIICSRAVLKIVPFTAVSTFVFTLYRCYSQLSAAVPDDVVDFCAKRDIEKECAAKFCDISVYLGCTKTGYAIAVRGFSALSIQLVVLVAARFVFLSYMPHAHIRGTCKCCHYECCSTGCCGSVGGLFAAVALLPMAFIQFYVSAWHFIAAIVIFVSLGVAEIADAQIQKNMEVSCFLSWFNTIFSIGGLVCFGGWFVIGPISQYLAATMPFFYFLPWAYQACTYTAAANEPESRVGLAVLVRG